MSPTIWETWLSRRYVLSAVEAPSWVQEVMLMVTKAVCIAGSNEQQWPGIFTSTAAFVSEAKC